jgi:hypothetical protein
MKRVRTVALVLIALAALICLCVAVLASQVKIVRGTPTPLPPTTTIECTPPPCGPDEIWFCAGDCPGRCGVTCVTPTPIIPSVTPMILCTPPSCKEGESYYCPGECPGGCGTTCATRTPTPAALCTPPPCGTDEIYYCPGECPGGCGTTCATRTPVVLGPLTPMIVCTPPPCKEGEIYFCFGDCPGGCGTTCATPTAVGSCAVITRTPPPGAPTEDMQGTPSSRQINPHVAICANYPKILVGETVTLIGETAFIGLPYFQVALRDRGAAEFAQLVEVTYNNEVRSQGSASQVLALETVTADMHHIVVTLRALAEGEVEIVINATGEVHYGYPGPAMWAGGGSDPITITVTR